MYKVKLLNKISPSGLRQLDNALFNCAENIENPDAILVRSANMHEMDINAKLKAVARAGAGVNNIPIEKLSEEGIVVFNTPGANANAVKELTLCALFLSSRKIAQGIDWVREVAKTEENIAAASEKGKSQFAGCEIEGKTLGIIGLGAIGVAVANTAHHLGMNVLGYDPYISVDHAWGLSRFVQKATSLKTLFEECDYITIHVPLSPETTGMLHEDSFASMKHGVKILNFSRGELINNEDMRKALESGKVSCYITDFPSQEVLSFPNTVVIPHLGASTPESEENCAVMAAKQLSDYLLNGNIQNSVNFPTVILQREGDVRICLLHRNIPNMLGQISTALASFNINIDNMINKSKKDYAYTLLDISGDLPEEVIKALKDAHGMIKVRVLKQN